MRGADIGGNIMAWAMLFLSQGSLAQLTQSEQSSQMPSFGQFKVY